MTQKTSPQVFQGAWKELENALFTDNQTPTFSFLGTVSFFIKPDGTQIFTIFDGSTVETRPLSVPWDMATFGAITKTFTISEVLVPAGLFFQDDGTKMFVLDIATKTVYEYTLPIPFDTDSIVDAPASLSLSVVTGTPVDLSFSRDGDFLYVIDNTVGNSIVYGFPLPTPWDVTSNVSNVSLPSGINFAETITFKREGDKMYLGQRNGTINEFDLSTVNDVTSAVANGNIFNTGMDLLRMSSKPTGLEFFIADDTTKIRKFHLEDAWNISTASYFANSLSIASNDTRAIVWKPDGLKFFTAERDTDVIREFSTPDPWNMSRGIEGATFDISTIEPNISSMWWKPDGTRLYIIGLQDKAIIQLNASTPYDVLTLSDSGISFTPSISGANPLGLFFRDDGNKMYLSTTDEVIIEYDLTLWDITTLVEVGNQDFSAFATNNLQDMFFKFDGKELFFIDFTLRTIFRTRLAIPWDIESTVFDVTSFVIGTSGFGPLGMFVRYDAEKIFICGNPDALLFTFDLLLEFNNSLITNLGDELVTDLGELLVHT